MGDLATWYLALGGVALASVSRVSWRLPVLVLAFAQYALHSFNHLLDVGEADPSWLGPANLVSLVLATALLAWMLQTERRAETTMRVFVAGASGAIGRPLVPRLLAAGHEVTGMTRSEERAELIRAAGARAAVVDVFDREALRAAVERRGRGGRRPRADRAARTDRLPRQAALQRHQPGARRGDAQPDGRRRGPRAPGASSARASRSSTSRPGGSSRPRRTPP